jgi:hypothetical protein
MPQSNARKQKVKSALQRIENYTPPRPFSKPLRDEPSSSMYKEFSQIEKRVNLHHRSQ